MASGTFVSFNKKQPGVYFNRKVLKRTTVNQGPSGIVVYPAGSFDWGERNKIIKITSLQDCFNKLGYYYTDDKMRPIVEMFRGSDRTKGASEVWIVIPNVSGQTKATATVSDLTATATCYGTRGNDISFIVQPDISTEVSTDDYAVVKVQTVVDGMAVYTKTCGQFIDSSHYTHHKLSDLVDNEFISWTYDAADKDNAIPITSGTNLTGGASLPATDSELSSVIDVLDNKFFNVLCLDSSSATLKAAFTNFIRRLEENKGFYCSMVCAKYNADFEGVTSIQNGMILSDNYILTTEKATWWYAGCSAGAKYNESLTHITHPLAVDVTQEFTSEELDSFIDAGQVAFIKEFDKVMVMKDINTLVTFTPEKGKDLQSNRLLRVLNEICNYCNYQYNINFIGVIPNTADGRDLIKSQILTKLSEMQSNNGIQNLQNDDVVVNTVEGDFEAVELIIAIQGVGAIEKIYIRLTAN